MERLINLTIERAIRVSRLDFPVFHAIARDPNATRQAALVVAVVAMASGIGAIGDSLGAVITAIIGAFLGWFIFSAMTWFFGRNVFGTPVTEVNIESLLRTQGYARAPGALALLGFIPVFGWAFVLASAVWALVTAIIAIRETLRISTSRAVLVAIAAAVTSAIIRIIIGIVFDVGGVVFI
ncbi:MAG TPA: YIP1 family protein [Thermomicrobiales bacterium]|nr:YIP1 family protein [Thermomicrobiales bacterium]